jgi:hypothetical protein
MSSPASPQRRLANRRNALRSTGPKSAAGKTRSAANALSHGLSAPIDVQSTDPLLIALSDCIKQEVHEPLAARQLASKILDYERNLAHQRALFVKQFDPFVINSGVETGVRSLFADELDMMDDYLEEQRVFKRSIAKKDLKFVSNMKLKMLKLVSRVDAHEQRERAREAMNSVRYLKRASNQLIKSLKALRVA